MKLIIIQKPQNGILGGPIAKSFVVQHNVNNYEITIEQGVQRRITITADQIGSNEEPFEVYYILETLFMLLDGQFYPVVSVSHNDIDITHSWKQRSLPSYHSADFMLGTGSVLIDFDSILNAQLFEKWRTLRKELDLIHNMVLYCLSNVAMPKDMQCAFMTEAFLGICELIHAKCSDFRLPVIPQGQSKLKCYLTAVITRNGAEIFAKENEVGKDLYTQILVDSRNRIAHIKSKQNRIYLDGGECVLYLMKLSLLYRVTLFDLLGISPEVYTAKLTARINAINSHDTMKAFLRKLYSSAT